MSEEKPNPVWWTTAQTKPVVVAFLASWCTHCQAFHPEVQRAIVASSMLRYPRRPIFAVDVPSLQDPIQAEVGQHVRAYPTVLRLRVQQNKLCVEEPFTGPRTASALLQFAKISKESGTAGP